MWLRGAEAVGFGRYVAVHGPPQERREERIPDLAQHVLVGCYADLIGMKSPRRELFLSNNLSTMP